MYIAYKNIYRYTAEWVYDRKKEHMVIHVTGLNSTKVFEDTTSFKDWMEELLMEELYELEPLKTVN